MSRLAFSGTLVLLLCAVAALATLWTPHPVDTVAIGARFQAPSPAHPLGTDHLGRDLVSMLMAGAANSLGVAAAAIGLGAALGTAVGLLMCATGGALHVALLRASDLLFAFPALIVAAILATAFGPGAGVAVVAIGVFNVPVFARLAAATGAGLMATHFADAARLSGKGEFRTAVEHALPNMLPVIATQAATQFAIAILAEAGLSYVGLGVQPPDVSWGRMLAEAQTLVFMAPGLALWPGLAIALSVCVVTAFGERLRVQFDPRRP
ncbi:MAG: ABC transporter permease [Pseudomonadota bacterium]